MNENIIVHDLKILDDLWLHDWEIKTINFDYPNLEFDLTDESGQFCMHIVFEDVRDKVFFKSNHTQISIDRVYGCEITDNNVDDIYNKFFSGYKKIRMTGKTLIAFDFNTEADFACICSGYRVSKMEN